MSEAGGMPGFREVGGGRAQGNGLPGEFGASPNRKLSYGRLCCQLGIHVVGVSTKAQLPPEAPK